MAKSTAAGTPLRPESLAPLTMTKQFRRDYLVVAVIPLVLLFVLVVIGSTVTGNYLSRLIVNATHDLNRDAEQSLEKLGERIILNKARDVARQLDIYFRMHPDVPITRMRNDPDFMKIAIQKVGETGYTAVTEANTYLFRVHPNAGLNDRDMRFLKDKMPSWWKIIQNAIDGDETTGYYDWIEEDGSVRKKYLATTPVNTPLQGITIMASATTYIDEFSKPVLQMRQNAHGIVVQYRKYVSRQWFIFAAIAGLMILLTVTATYFWGQRAALRYIRPIELLADAARAFGKNNLTANGYEQITRRKDEVGTLARSFFQMSSQLAQLFNRLENQVTELKTTQKALEKSQEHYRELYETAQKTQEVYQSLIHSSADAIVTVDLTGAVTYVSPKFTEIFGWHRKELMGRPLPYVPESEEPAALGVFSDVIESGTAFHGYEGKRETKDGRLIDVSISASRYDDHLGRPAGMLVILRDITEKKRIEAHLKHVERMEAIGTLAGGIAHDFNNILMVIQGSITVLMRNTDLSHTACGQLEKIESQIRRGAGLTRQLLGYARKGKYDVKVLNLNERIRDNTDTVGRTRKDIAVHYDLAGNLHPVEVDIYQVDQILMNILINAFDAMPDGGDLFIATKNVTPRQLPDVESMQRFERLVMMRIKDTGIGMPPQILDRIFDPFFTTKEMGRGTGLGLASVYGIVKAHGGHIRVDSQEGEGTAISIFLAATDKPVRDVPKRETEKLSKGKGTILIIDDEQCVLEVCEEMVETIGYTAVTADNGQEALEYYKNHFDRVDLILLDMIMPDMGGSAAFNRLRAINPDAAVILSSGFSVDGKAEEILSRGCKGFIQKPYTVEQLAAKIKTCLNRG